MPLERNVDTDRDCVILQNTFFFTKLDVLRKCQGEREGLMRNNDFPTKILFLLKVMFFLPQT